jgi:hypothetical protein
MNEAASLQLALALFQQNEIADASRVLFEAFRDDDSFRQSHAAQWQAVADQPDIFAVPRLWKEALELKFHSAELFNNIAWILATHPDAKMRQGSDAVQFAQRAIEIKGRLNPSFLDTLAAAQAEAGSFNDAAITIQKAIDTVVAAGDTNSTTLFRTRLALYKNNQPYRER